MYANTALALITVDCLFRMTESTGKLFLKLNRSIQGPNSQILS